MGVLNMVNINGVHTEVKNKPDSLDIPYRASKCLDNMLEMSDREFGYIPYIGGSLGEDRPHFVHHRLDFTEVLPYSILGITAARNISGSDKGIDIQMKQRETLLKYISIQDGLIYTPDSPWNPNKTNPMSIWEQARTLYALIYWYQDTKDDFLIDIMEKMIGTLYSMTRQYGRMRVFSDKVLRESIMERWGIGALIDPLVKYHEMTGSAKALSLAEGLTFFYLKDENGFFGRQGEFKGFFRPVAGVINGISKFACLKGDDLLVARVKAIHDYALSKCTSYGSTPCHEPACSTMELNMSSLYLIRIGFDEYYDRIDKFVRNQVCEAQFLDAGEWVAEKTHKGRIMEPKFVYEDYPEDLETLPYDDYNNIVERSVGGFMWCSADEHSFMPASIMLCCSAHAMRSFQIVWENALIRRVNKVDVNFNYNMENEVGEIISHEPFEGRISVILKDDAEKVRVRLPDYTLGKEVRAYVGGIEKPFDIEGRYISIKNIRKLDTISVHYPLCKRNTEETQYSIEPGSYDAVAEKTYDISWRGNTVIGVLPESKAEKRIYKRRHLDSDDTPFKAVSCFIPENRLFW